ncbi:MAG: lipocalin-like domain-containing protein [Pseudomonadota bacterium]
MNVRTIVLAAVLALLAPGIALAQGFAGLGEAADGFALPERGHAFEFPRDHGPHPEFRIEWWYVTATLTGADGRDYGVQWTLFRSARAPTDDGTWATPQVWMGHAAVTTPDAHRAAERFARGGAGQAGATATPTRAWIDDWELTSDADLSEGRLTARGPDFAYDLSLSADGPIVFHGDAGYSVKSTGGQASYYFSQPFFEVTGTLTLPEGDIAVTGEAWLDREYSSQPLGRTQTGWDWFSLSFDSGDKLMGFLLRDTEGDLFTAGTWITPDGTTEALPNGAFMAEPLEETRVAGRDIPTTWRVTLRAKGVDVTTTALNPQAWNDLVFAYWEGPIAISGSHSGKGYLEMTGYE